MTPAGLPHSEISGSLVVCTSPELIAAYHVLHRLLTPRHPPFALCSLTEHLGARLLHDQWSCKATAAFPFFPIQLSKSRRSGAHSVAGSRNSFVGSSEDQLGGDNRARTGNLRRARAALSQLSYIPIVRRRGGIRIRARSPAGARGMRGGPR